MEKQVYDKLSKKDQALLASLGEVEALKAIISAGNQYQQDKAEHIALAAPDMENVLINRGMIHGARFTYDLIKYAYKQQNKQG